MTNHRIRLVHSDILSNKAKEGRLEWDFENARQLGLFDDFNIIRIVFVPVADVSAHSFMKALEEDSPHLVLDTRSFPDFFSVFVSTASALEEFHRREINYSRIPIQSSNMDDRAWSQLGALKSLLASHLEKKTNAPVFILSSTRKNLNRVSDKLKGYILQEVSDARFKEISPHLT